MTTTQRLRVGDELQPYVRTLTAAQMKSYSTWPEGQRNMRNQHTDEAVAKSLGRPGVIAQGLQISALVHELLTQGFGAAWMRGGTLKVRFLKMVVSGDTLTVSGRVTAVEPLPDADRVTIDIQAQNQRGELPLVGTATVRVPRR